MNPIKRLAQASRVVWSDPSNDGQWFRRLFGIAAWQRWKRTVRTPVIIRLDNGLDCIAEPSASNATCAIYDRVYEARSVWIIRKHAVDGGVLIDVGAHTGLFALLIAHRFASVVCFEPAQTTLRLSRSGPYDGSAMVRSACRARHGDTGGHAG